MKKYLFILLLIPIHGFSQIMFQKTFGGVGFEDAHVVHEIPGEGYVIAGTSNSFGNGSNDCMLFKIDLQGNELWMKTYGGDGDEDSHYAVLTSDGGVALIAYSNSFGGGDYDMYLIKTDSNGDTLWTKTYGDTTNEYGYCLQQTPDSGFILVGKKEDSITGTFDVWIIKTDAQGTVEWDTTYGDSLDDYARFIELTDDGGFIIAGTSHNTDSSDAEIYLIKTDSDGQVEWENKFNQSVHAFGYAVQQTYDGGYLMTGHSYDNNLCWGFPSYNVIIIKVDSSGSELWRSVPMGTIWGCMTYAAHSIRETSDSGFVLCGMSYVESICKTAADPDTGLPYTSNMILYKGDKDGNYVWSHEIYGSYKTMGTFGTETSDGGYIFTAYQGIDYATDGDALVIKTNSVGTLVGLDERSSDELGVAVYPNPASAFIILDPIATAKYSFSIYDGLGRIVLSGNEMKGKLKVNISTLTYGMYHLRLGSDHHLMSKKIIITK